MSIAVKYAALLCVSVWTFASSGETVTKISEVMRHPLLWLKQRPWDRRNFLFALSFSLITWGWAIWDDLSSQSDNEKQRRTLYDQTRQLNWDYSEFCGSAAGCPAGRARPQSASAVLGRVAA